jgi:hypothetical protein
MLETINLQPKVLNFNSKEADEEKDAENSKGEEAEEEEKEVEEEEEVKEQDNKQIEIEEVPLAGIVKTKPIKDL